MSLCWVVLVAWEAYETGYTKEAMEREAHAKTDACLRIHPMSAAPRSSGGDYDLSKSLACFAYLPRAPDLAFVGRQLVLALSLPVAALFAWFVGLWIVGGFRQAVTADSSGPT